MELSSSSMIPFPPPPADASSSEASAGGRAPRSFLPEFADERNRALDREIRVRGHGRHATGPGQLAAGHAPTRLPPAAPAVCLAPGCLMLTRLPNP